MNIKKLVCVLSVVALASAASAQTQSLTELAKIEKQRRAKMRTTAGAAKVYTEGDRTGTTVDPAATGTTGAPAATGEAQPAVAGAKKTKEKTPEELAADKQAEWAARLKQTQDQITEMQSSIARNERTLSSTFNITPARADLVNQIETEKRKVAELQQQLVTLEDERRRAGMPRR